MAARGHVRVDTSVDVDERHGRGYGRFRTVTFARGVVFIVVFYSPDGHIRLDSFHFGEGSRERFHRPPPAPVQRGGVATRELDRRAHELDVPGVAPSSRGSIEGPGISVTTLRVVITLSPRTGAGRRRRHGPFTPAEALRAEHRAQRARVPRARVGDRVHRRERHAKSLHRGRYTR